MQNPLPPSFSLIYKVDKRNHVQYFMLNTYVLVKSAICMLISRV